ncbi:MAG: MOSC N-terminal beta barrel domain-containing protein [Thermoleophilaceae bacterium]
MATVAWIAFTPVKGLRLHQVDEVELAADGVPGDRAFFLVDSESRMVSSPRLGALVAVTAACDPDRSLLRLTFPDGKEVAGEVVLGEPEAVGFRKHRLNVRPVLGAFSEALSEHAGKALRLVASPPGRSAVDRGPGGTVTLLSLASLERLREQAGVAAPVDQRRFRMTFGADGLDPHGEDDWIGHVVRIGEALVAITGNVGRCVLTTRNADTGVVDFKTLHHLRAYRDGVETSEALPFGVYGRVVAPGRVAVGGPIEPVRAPAGAGRR